VLVLSSARFGMEKPTSRPGFARFTAMMQTIVSVFKTELQKRKEDEKQCQAHRGSTFDSQTTLCVGIDRALLPLHFGFVSIFKNVAYQ
jgi:hypothetical protein